VVLDGEDVRVGVSGRITPLGPVPLSVGVSAEAVGRLEPAVTGAGAGAGAGADAGAGAGGSGG